VSGAPGISVIVPAYNAEAYLERSVGSVLGQTHQDLEVLVVDDGSTDGSVRILTSFDDPRLRIVSQQNRGVAAARNRGLQAARGRLISFLDADDAWMPDKLEREVDVLDRHPEVAGVLSAMLVCDDALRPLHPWFPPTEDHLRCLILLDSMVGISQAALLRKEVLDALGGFDEALSTSADWDLLVRLLLRREEVATHQQPTVLYRLRPDSMSTSATALSEDMDRALGKLFSSPGLPPDLRRLRRRAYGRLHRILAGSQFQDGLSTSFLRHSAKALSLSPREAAYFASLPMRRSRRASGRGQGLPAERLELDGGWSPSVAEHASRYRLAAPTVTGARVLDIACGTGHGAAHLLEAGARHVVAIDLDPLAIATASRFTAPGLTVVRASGESLPIPDRSIDVVTSFETIEHIQDMDQFLSELHRVMRHDARLILSTPNGLVTCPDGESPTNPYHLRELTPLQLRRLLEPQFEIEAHLGQRTSAAYGPCPYWQYDPSPGSARAGTKAMIWKALVRLPTPVGARLSELVLRRPLYPGEDDFEFSVDGLTDGHVQLVACRRS
jgi:glycosyltransferase involved in cell wall biosynthesis/2-polyprenyl-3-methyl-5-hydroxy-6-metoxy-1,4-benzoquinol methylase